MYARCGFSVTCSTRPSRNTLKHRSFTPLCMCTANALQMADWAFLWKMFVATTTMTTTTRARNSHTFFELIAFATILLFHSPRYLALSLVLFISSSSNLKKSEFWIGVRVRHHAFHNFQPPSTTKTVKYWNLLRTMWRGRGTGERGRRHKTIDETQNVV